MGLMYGVLCPPMDPHMGLRGSIWDQGYPYGVRSIPMELAASIYDMGLPYGTTSTHIGLRASMWG